MFHIKCSVKSVKGFCSAIDLFFWRSWLGKKPGAWLPEKYPSKYNSNSRLDLISKMMVLK